MQRLINYLSVFLVVPVMMVSAAVMTASSSSEVFLQLVTGIPYLGMVVEVGEKLTPYALIIGAFIFVYLVVPNTRVDPRSALFGALLAGFLWKIIAVLFAWFITYSTNYTAIYSGFAIVFLLIIWIYLGWLIVLTGSSFAFYHQYPQRLNWRSGDFDLSAVVKEQISCQLMVNIARCYSASSPELTSVNELARYQRIPIEVVRRMARQLEADGLIKPIKRGSRCYMPTREPESILVIDILRSARRAQDNRRSESLYCEPAVASLTGNIETALASSLEDQTLAELINHHAE